MSRRVTLRLDRGGVHSRQLTYRIRVGGVDVGNVDPIPFSGGWRWYAQSNALGIPRREVMLGGDFYAAKRDALAYVRECLAKKEGPS